MLNLPPLSQQPNNKAQGPVNGLLRRRREGERERGKGNIEIGTKLRTVVLPPERNPREIKQILKKQENDERNALLSNNIII